MYSNVSRFWLIWIFPFYSDCSCIEEDLSPYGPNTLIQPSSTSSINSYSDRIFISCNYHHPLNTTPTEQHLVTNSNKDDLRLLACDEDDAHCSRSVDCHPANNNNFSKNDDEDLDSVKTFPADSSFEISKQAKYKEKRQRNNMAAKKSRDARKVRENQLKIKVLCLENANDVLRAQIQREQDENRKQREKIKELQRKIGESENNT